MGELLAVDLEGLRALGRILAATARAINAISITATVTMPGSPIVPASEQNTMTAADAYTRISGNVAEMSATCEWNSTTYEGVDEAFSSQLTRYDSGFARRRPPSRTCGAVNRASMLNYASAILAAGATEVQTFQDEPGNHEVRSYSPEGTAIFIGSRGAVIWASTGCRLPLSKIPGAQAPSPRSRRTHDRLRIKRGSR